jgi:hypothetical protein
VAPAHNGHDRSPVLHQGSGVDRVTQATHCGEETKDLEATFEAIYLDDEKKQVSRSRRNEQGVRSRKVKGARELNLSIYFILPFVSVVCKTVTLMY